MLKKETVFCIGTDLGNDNTTERKVTLADNQLHFWFGSTYDVLFVCSSATLPKDCPNLIKLCNVNGVTYACSVSEAESMDTPPQLEYAIGMDYSDNNASIIIDDREVDIIKDMKFDYIYSAENNEYPVGLKLYRPNRQGYIAYSRQCPQCKAIIDDNNGVYNQVVVFFAGTTSVGKSTYESSLIDNRDGTFNDSCARNTELPAATQAFRHKTGQFSDAKMIMRFIDMPGENLNHSIRHSDDIKESLRFSDVCMLFCEPIQLFALNRFLSGEGRLAYDYLIAKGVSGNGSSNASDEAFYDSTKIQQLLNNNNGLLLPEVIGVTDNDFAYAKFINKRIFLVFTKSDQIDALYEYANLPTTDAKVQEKLLELLMPFNSLQISKKSNSDGQGREEKDSYAELKLRSTIAMNIVRTLDNNLFNRLTGIINKQKEMFLKDNNASFDASDLFVRVFTVMSGKKYKNNSSDTEHIDYLSGWRVNDPINAILDDPLFK